MKEISTSFVFLNPRPSSALGLQRFPQYIRLQWCLLLLYPWKKTLRFCQYGHRWLFEKGSVFEYSVIEKRTDLMRVALAVCEWTFASHPSILALIFETIPSKMEGEFL